MHEVSLKSRHYITWSLFGKNSLASLSGGFRWLALKGIFSYLWYLHRGCFPYSGNGTTPPIGFYGFLSHANYRALVASNCWEICLFRFAHILYYRDGLRIYNLIFPCGYVWVGRVTFSVLSLIFTQFFIPPIFFDHSQMQRKACNIVKCLGIALVPPATPSYCHQC